jgi:hypothetical protein
LRAFVATCGAFFLAATVSATQLGAQDRAADLRSRFEHETNAVQKAKLMPDLGQVEFQQIRKEVEAYHFAAALDLLRAYQVQVSSCVKALASTNVDPEKHPSGYKQLQISVAESLRRIDALLPPMTADEQAPFLEIRRNLDEVNRRLIEQLFPGQTPAPTSHKVVQ